MDCNTVGPASIVIVSCSVHLTATASEVAALLVLLLLVTLMLFWCYCSRSPSCCSGVTALGHPHVVVSVLPLCLGIWKVLVWITGSVGFYNVSLPKACIGLVVDGFFLP